MWGKRNNRGSPTERSGKSIIRVVSSEPKSLAVGGLKASWRMKTLWKNNAVQERRVPSYEGARREIHGERKQSRGVKSS